LDAAVLLSGAYDFHDPASLIDTRCSQFGADVRNYVGCSPGPACDSDGGLLDLASPYRRFTNSSSPVFIIASNLDPIPPNQFTILVNLVAAVGVPNCEHSLIIQTPGPNGCTGHSFALWPIVKDQAIAVESLESIGFSAGATITVSIKEEDAPTFLYYYFGKKLDDVVDQNVRSFVQMVLSREFGNRNLSDCAAMACLPAAAIATVALPRGMGIEFARELYLGLREAGDEFDCPIIGGDTASWDAKLALSVTILGRSDGIAPITRSGAKANDGIYVTGPLGGSILGRHMIFTPRITEARELAKSSPISAMIDISDGLSRDLARICQQSNVGAVIDASAIPIHSDAITLSKKTGQSPLEHALHDGEDHELLFACSARPPVGTLIGTITADRSLLIQENAKTEPLSQKGWDYPL